MFCTNFGWITLLTILPAIIIDGMARFDAYCRLAACVLPTHMGFEISVQKTSVMQESDMIPPSYEQANKIMYIFAVDYFYGIFVYFPALLHRLYKIVTMFCITYTS